MNEGQAECETSDLRFVSERVAWGNALWRGVGMASPAMLRSGWITLKNGLTRDAAGSFEQSPMYARMAEGGRARVHGRPVCLKAEAMTGRSLSGGANG